MRVAPLNDLAVEFQHQAQYAGGRRAKQGSEKPPRQRQPSHWSWSALAPLRPNRVRPSRNAASDNSFTLDHAHVAFEP
jgi:hypothetical protein